MCNLKKTLDSMKHLIAIQQKVVNQQIDIEKQIVIVK